MTISVWDDPYAYMSHPVQVRVAHTHIMWAACVRMRRQPKRVWAYGTEQNSTDKMEKLAFVE